MLIDSDGDPLREFLQLTTHEEIDQAHLEGTGGGIVHPTLMARREEMVAVGGYRKEYYPAEDVDLFLRLAERGELYNVPEVLLLYRRHFESTGAVHHTRQMDSTRRAIADAFRRRGRDAAVPHPPGHQLRSLADHCRLWAWWALERGNVTTARKHAYAAIRHEPFSLASWKVAVCALRGR
jgi:hypothetical protein